jgi:hypothetical protein
VNRRTRAALAGVVLALTLAACTPPKPQPSPPTVPQGFDACAAPSLTTMQTWWASSPFTSIGIYVGGANRACAQPNLTKTWVDSTTAMGWGLLPIWVGPQAPCTTLGSTTKLPADDFYALIGGYLEATAAANRMDTLGFGWLAPVYYDLEAYPRGNAACTRQVQSFANGWVYGLNTRGYLAGLYSSLCSGIVDLQAGLATAKYVMNDIWIAAWNNTPNVFGFDIPPCPLKDTNWMFHQRVHQFKGGHDETWGGVTINVDSNAVDGDTHRR